MIALSRKTKDFHQVWCANEADAPTLLDRAHAGDTLHLVEATHSADELMRQIGSQLANNQYKRI